MNVIASDEKRNKPFFAIVGTLSIAGVGVLDLLTGYEIAFSLFYLVPVFLLTWYVGRWIGIAGAAVSAAAWLIAELESGHVYLNPVAPYWNTVIRLGFFLITALLLSSLRNAHRREKELARSDPLTGALNARSFSEVLLAEMDRARRSKTPFTVAYLDLDNFKSVNDRLGHSAGDQVLRVTVAHLKNQLRKVDVVARVGGDEFAILLPETDRDAARTALQRAQTSLRDEMRRNRWPLTVSVGVLTCLDVPSSIDDVLGRADRLMYAVKKRGKNAARYAVYSV